jgi:hypothetical protein
MKPLPTVLKIDGFTHHQCWRRGDVAVFRQMKFNQHPAYEVIRINKNKAGTRFGRDFLASESYPTAQQWGSRGWTFPTMEAAEAKFNELTRP